MTGLVNFLIADLFCGAGGTSTGAELAIREIGGQMILVCVNHWPVAIETHKKNHPTARHYVEDVTVADPNKIVTEGYLDLLCASPECRYYSRARGGKPVHDQGRMNPWAVHRWLTSLNVRCLLVENVPEFMDWGPLLFDGTPDPKGKGLFFQSWVKALWEMGYKAEWRLLNAANYGDATTRTRFFLIARNDGHSIVWPEPSHRENGAAEMFSELPKWRSAREIIDWNNTGRSLLDDPRYLKRPLSEKTRKRIARGLEKFGGALAPYYIRLLGLEPVMNPEGDKNEPFVLNRNGENGGARTHSIDSPLPTATTRGAGYLVLPGIESFVMGKQGHSPAYRSIEEPIPSVTCESASKLIEPVIEPFVLGQHSGSAPRSVENPIPTVMSDGAISVVTPTMVKYYGNGDCKSVEDPVPTLTTKDRVGLASPVLVEVNHGGHDDRCRSVDKPLGVLTTKRGTALISPFIVPQFSEREMQKPRFNSIENPLPAVTGHGAGALVEPVITHVNGIVDPRRVVEINGQPYVLDIKFRMLSNLELARAMGFTNNETTYEFVGNIGEVTRQIGNAVPVNLAKALVLSILKEA
ncbi:MAG: DNA cytosine methyltransferase [Chloroflexota bacterium]